MGRINWKVFLYPNCTGFALNRWNEWVLKRHIRDILRLNFKQFVNFRQDQLHAT